MSAFVVRKLHIDRLTATAVHGPSGVAVNPGTAWYGVTDPDSPTFERLRADDADRIGAELWAENVRSVRYRYDDPEGIDLPGPLDFLPEHAAEYRFPPMSRPLTVVEAIKAAHCLRYQSCEHPGWEASWSARFLVDLIDSLTRYFPGYSDADGWEVRSTGLPASLETRRGVGH